MNLNRFVKILIIVTMGLSCATPLFSQSAEEIAQTGFELFAARDNGQTRLYWDCRSWPGDLKGFVIKRAVTGTDNWVTLSRSPVIPAIDNLMDFSSRGITDAEIAAEFIEALNQFLDDGLVSLVSENDMRQILVERNGLGSGDRIRMKNDFRLALISGFAYLDTGIPEDTLFDYALFPYYVNGSTGTKPLDIYRAPASETVDIEVGFRISKESVILEWITDKDMVKALAILGYTVERRLLSEDKYLSISVHPVGGIDLTDGDLLFRIVDNTADPANDYMYRLTAVNMFQQRGDVTEALFIAGHYRSLGKPKIDIVALHEESDMALSWSVNPEDSALISAFILELSFDPGKELNSVIIDTIEPSSRWYIDTHPKIYGEVYFYHIRALGKYGQQAISDPEAFYYMGLAKPPKVKNLTGKLLRANDSTFVHLKWSSVSNLDSITKGFAVYSDELIPDSLLQLSSLPLITDNEFRYPITTQGGRVYKFRVAGLSAQGKAGDPGEVEINIGRLKLPKIYNISAELITQHSILVKWDYPEFSDIVGFRLFINNKENAGIDKISGDMRSYIISDIRDFAGEIIQISMIAIGSDAVSEKGIQHRFSIPSIKRESSIPAPTSFTFEILNQDTDTILIQLCWTPPLVRESEITGYALYSDYYTPGRLQRMNTIPVIRGTEYIYVISDPGRDEIMLGVAAVLLNGENGAIKDTIIPVKK